MSERTKALMKRAVVRLSFGHQYQLKDAYLGLRDRIRRRSRPARAPAREFAVTLPDGFGARRAIVSLSIPDMPSGHFYSFAEHVDDGEGLATNWVLATSTGRIAISDDLGTTWREVRIRGFARYPIIHAKMLACGNLLLQATDPASTGSADLKNVILVADLTGDVLHCARMNGAYWHGPRAVDEAGGTIMYAENTPNRTGPHRHAATVPSRVWRSRDGGRAWSNVFGTDSIRHFHFLQARPGKAGEWWLTSGDHETESRIWRSTDDGDTWTDLTACFGLRVKLGQHKFSRRIFRLTDLVWNGDSIGWGTDDPLEKIVATEGAAPLEPGARAFRWNPDAGGAPEIIGTCGPPVRNIVELPEHHLLITQGLAPFDRNRPRALLMRKDGAGGVVTLFEIDEFSRRMPSFTQSRASRVAKNGVFFTARSEEDVFDHPQRILRWEIRLD